MNTHTVNANIDTNSVTHVMLRPTPTWHHDLSEIASLILGVENGNQEYWAEELDNGRVYIETNTYDGEEWDAALSVFVVGSFIGDVLLRGAGLGRSR